MKIISGLILKLQVYTNKDVESNIHKLLGFKK